MAITQDDPRWSNGSTAVALTVAAAAPTAVAAKTTPWSPSQTGGAAVLHPRLYSRQYQSQPQHQLQHQMRASLLKPSSNCNSSNSSRLEDPKGAQQRQRHQHQLQLQHQLRHQMRASLLESSSNCANNSNNSRLEGSRVVRLLDSSSSSSRRTS